MNHVVVVNDEGQYSLLPQRQPLPEGWRPAGFSGSRQDCLEQIGRVWTDIRPRGILPGKRDEA